MSAMATHEKPANRGARRAAIALVTLGAEYRTARTDRGLSLRDVGAALDISHVAAGRVERGLVPGVSLMMLTRYAEVVGLELSVRAYAGGAPVRDAAHVALLADFRAQLSPRVSWATEVPFPSAGDARAWDALIRGDGWLYGVEAETAPRDVQALGRRMSTKLRDGNVDGLLLVLPSTRRTREFLDAGETHLGPLFPVSGGRALALLRAGLDPGGSAIIVLPKSRSNVRGSRPPVSGFPGAADR
jgi:transcriptional regulator with XRE-family HTH domain